MLMPLPMTKGELNRLGDRLIASGTPSTADLDILAAALGAYQDELERVKAHLRDLGYAPAGRVKTMTTLTDKLRRTHGMQLSRVQDLAGARIVVRDLAAQDEARDKISQFYASRGHACREVDRRADPRFGYKAVHLIVRLDEILVEIQVRTELQDTWAQIVERLADRWGRGIRYGGDPEDPEAVVRSGNFVMSRREALKSLMSLSDAITAVEQARRSVDQIEHAAGMAAGMFGRDLVERLDPQMLASKIPAELMSTRSGLADILTEHSDDLDADARDLLDAGSDLTGAQLLRLGEIAVSLLRRDAAEPAATLSGSEQALRDMLRLIASASDEGA
jgi:ppGpp synthetase/RelA/SpoT-type nucleotidyltranferase